MKKYVMICTFAIGLFFSGCTEESTPTAEEEKEYPFTISIQNISDTYALSSGLLVVHTNDFTLINAREKAPQEFQLLSESGETGDFIRYLRKQPGVLLVQEIPGITKAGSRTLIPLTISQNNMQLSVIRKIEDTENEIALIDSVSIFANGEAITGEEETITMSVKVSPVE